MLLLVMEVLLICPVGLVYALYPRLDGLRQDVQEGLQTPGVLLHQALKVEDFEVVGLLNVA